jgi:chaperone required for assembly of F1-ATPase
MTTETPRDWFPDDEKPVDALKAARQAMRDPLPKRFYEAASVEPGEGGFVLVLDGRPARTPARSPLALPTHELGEAVAAEWGTQGETIDPASMPLTRMANTAIDGVAPRRREVVDDLVRYAGSDLVCYRAGDPARLAAEQDAAWNPVLAWADRELGARFVLAEGVMHVDQPEAAVAAVRRAVEAVESPFALAALHVMTTLTGSVLIALAHARGEIDADRAWTAAHVDELYQESVWGEDAEAAARRAARRAEFQAASTLSRLSATS